MSADLPRHLTLQELQAWGEEVKRRTDEIVDNCRSMLAQSRNIQSEAVRLARGSWPQTLLAQIDEDWK